MDEITINGGNVTQIDMVQETARTFSTMYCKVDGVFMFVKASGTEYKPGDYVCGNNGLVLKLVYKPRRWWQILKKREPVGYQILWMI